MHTCMHAGSLRVVLYYIFVVLNLVLADDVGIPTLFERLRKDKIKDISRKQGSLEYTLSE